MGSGLQWSAGRPPTGGAAAAVDPAADVAGLADAVDILLCRELTTLSSAELLERLRELERVRRRLAAVDHRLIAEITERRLAGDYGRPSTADLLVHELRVSPGEARTRVRQAADLGPRSSLTGQALPPLMPHSAATVAAGDISAAHVAVIGECLDAAPAQWSVAELESVEQALTGFARLEHPAALRRTAVLLMARLDPDGTEPRDELLHRRRELHLSRNRDGSGSLHGRLTAEATAIWDTIIDSLGAPAPHANGSRDDRSAAQRRHDAFAEAGQRLLRSGTLPAAGGIPVTILLRTTPAELASGDGLALTSRGDRIPMRDAIRGSGDGEIAVTVLDQDGAILSHGRSRRLASRAQRMALAARDGGCTFPGCDRPAGWTEVHHVLAWERGGPSDVDNMCLVCRFHHRELDRNDWQVRMNHGMPEWIPPPVVDPARGPRRNTAHHRPDIVFTPTPAHAA